MIAEFYADFAVRVGKITNRFDEPNSRDAMTEGGNLCIYCLMRKNSPIWFKKDLRGQFSRDDYSSSVLSRKFATHFQLAA